MKDPIEQFRDAIRAAGLNPPEIIVADGKWHRFSPSGTRDDDAGTYLLHGDGVPVGFFRDWRTDLFEKWRADIGRELSESERAAYRARMDALRAAREAEQVQRRAEARSTAGDRWDTADPADPAHPYLVTKGVKPCGVRQRGGSLLVPMRNAGGELVNLQTIDADGDKRFLFGGEVSGCYFAIGKPTGRLCIVEGFATGASVREATGDAVAVAFNAGNLKPVAMALRAKFPELPIVLCADDDYRTAGNPGITKATEAARAVGGLMAVPDFGQDRPEKATDFNDLMRHRGAESVRQCVASATAAPEAPHGEQAGAIDQESASTRSRASGGSGGVSLILTSAADLTPEPVQWLWDGWLAAGKLHILAGAPGTGKTTAAISLAATVSRGGRWPDGTRTKPAGVLIASYEDDPADTITPRLIAAGADLDRVHILEGTWHGTERRSFSAKDDAALLAEAIKTYGVRLVIVDPIISALGSFDSHKNAETRQALQPLADVARESGAALLGIAHFSKGSTGRDPLERVSGSLAFGAVARVVMAAAKVMNEDGTDRRLFARVKSNIGPDSGGFVYDLEQVEALAGVPASRTRWGEAVEGDARELLAESEPDRDVDSMSDLEQFIRDELDRGPISANDFRKDAEGAGYQWRTVQRVAKRIGAESRKSEMRGPWKWGFYDMPKATTRHEGDEDDTTKCLTPSSSSAPSLSPSVPGRPDAEAF